MMKLVLFLVFSSLFSCSALECLSSITNSNVTCGPNEFCITEAVIDSFGRRHQEKSCSPSFLCNPMRGVRSYNLGFDSKTQSYVCCNTDHCNSEDLPYPDITKNGLQCSACQQLNSTICNQKVECVGVQDRCIAGTEPNGFKSYGCISRNLCDLGRPPPVDNSQNNTGPTCCESSFCNSAQPVTESGQENSASSIMLSVFSVLIPLIALII